MNLITSQNRGQAKKLLTMLGHSSVEVRTMKLDRLNAELQNKINAGLITLAGALRALTKHSEQQNDAQNDRKDAEQESAPEDTDEDYDGKESSSGAGEQEGEGEEESQGNGGDTATESESESNNETEESEQEGDFEQDDHAQGESEDTEGKGNAEANQQKESEEDEEQDEESKGDQSDTESDENETKSDESEEDDNEEDEESDEHCMLTRVLGYIKSGLNVALVGPAGTGKSYLARQVAAKLELDFYTHGAMMSKYDLIGYNDANGVYHATPAHDAACNGGLLCLDEMDASAPDAVVSINALTDSQPVFTWPVGQKQKHADFVCIVCLNTYGNGASADYVGRYKQDAAVMSRYVKVYIDYDVKVERKLAGKHKDILQRVHDLRAVTTDLGIRHIVSTRMIEQAVAARDIGKVSKGNIDADILFAGLDDGAISQVKTRMNTLKRDRKATDTRGPRYNNEGRTS